jgi:ABC-type phosphate/phosphonate transport system substrate-binding protein
LSAENLPIHIEDYGVELKFLTCLKWQYKFFLFACLWTGSCNADVFTLGVVPQFEARQMHAIWKPIVQVLESRTDHRFELISPASIPEFEDRFARGDFDFVYLNPWHAVVANDTQGYLPLLKDGNQTLQGILVVHKGSGIQSIQQLNDQKIAFPAPNALGASLLMRAELSKLHHIDFAPIYVGTHTSAYLNVALQQTAAAGGVARTLQQQEPILQNLLQVIYRTQAVSPHPIAVHPRVPKVIRKFVVDAFMAMKDDPQQQLLLAEIPMPEPEAATIDDYFPLKRLGLNEIKNNQ